MPHVMSGWNSWRRTGVFPAYEDIVKHSEAWVTDILLMDDWYRWVNNKSAAMTVATAMGFNEGELITPNIPQKTPNGVKPHE